MKTNLTVQLARFREHLHDDDGFTVMEMVVAMTLMAVFMGIFTTVIYMMTSNSAKIQRSTNAVTQVNQAFIALDKSVRYASAIMQPAKSSTGTWHVEYDSDLYVNGVQTDTCTQLRVFASSTGVNQQLQMRTWKVSGNSYNGLTGWRTLANNITNGSSSSPSPFVTSSIAASAYQQLTVTLTAASDNQTTKDTNTAKMTFSGVNSTAGTTPSVCQQVPVDSTS